MSLRNSLSRIAIALAFLVGASGLVHSRAFAADNGNKVALEEILKTLERDYKGLITETLKNQIDGYFALRLQDFASTSGILRFRVQQDHERIAELEVRWEKVNLRLGALTEVDALELLDLVQEARILERRSRVLKSDLELLAQGWAERCDAGTLAYPEEQFRPRAQFAPTHSELKPDAGDWALGVTATFGNSSQGTPGVSGTSSFDAAGIGANVGMAIGSCFGGVGAPVGAALGALVGWAITTFGYVDELNEQWDLISRIWNVQEQHISALASTSTALIRTRCGVLLEDQPAKDGPMMSRILSSFSEDARKHMERAGVLNERVSKAFDAVKRTTFDRLQAASERRFQRAEASYFQALDDRFASAAALDLEAMEFLAERGGSEDPAELWDLLIDGDVKFNPEAGFGFLSAGQGSVPAGRLPMDGSLIWNAAVSSVSDLISGKVKQ